MKTDHNATFDTIDDLTRKAENGDVACCSILGLLHLKGERGVEKCNKKAIQYLSIAASHYEPSALFHLGMIKYDESDYQSAFDLLMSSASLGKTYAAVMVGKMFQLGLGRPVNNPIAFRYFEYASEHGDHHAWFYLRVCFYYGIGTDKSEIYAERIWKRILEEAELSVISQFCDAIDNDGFPQCNSTDKSELLESIASREGNCSV